MFNFLTKRLSPKTRRMLRWTRGFYSLQFKASVFVVLLVLVVTGFGTALGMKAMTAVLYENEFVRTQEWANSLAGNCVDAVVMQDRTWLVQASNRLGTMSGVAYVLFTDADRKVLAYSETMTGLVAGLTDSTHTIMPLRQSNKPMLLHFKKQKLNCIDVLVPIYDRRLICALWSGYFRRQDKAGPHRSAAFAHRHQHRTAAGAVQLIAHPICRFTAERSGPHRPSHREWVHGCAG
jgi:hypothetical protein